MKNLIHQFKFGQKTMLRHLFSELMASFIRSNYFDIRQFDHLVPIPLSATRLRERGFNQSQLLAELISREFKVPLSTAVLSRIKNTSSQSLLHQKERWTNIKGAFRIKNQFHTIGKNILLIDDLLTTGATSSEAALIIKNAGAKRVGVLTLAVAP